MLNLAVGGIFIIIGSIFKLFPPKKINSFYGYRTSTSMKNQSIWNYAQKISARSMIVLGFINLFIGMSLIALYNNLILSFILFLITTITMLIMDELILRRIVKESLKK